MLEPRTRKLDARPFNVVSAVVILAPCLKASKRNTSYRRRFDLGYARCMRLLNKSQTIS